MWQGNGIFRSGGMDFVPEGTSAAARLLAGVYGPHPNQNAPPGFGGVVAGPSGAQTYGSGSQLAQLLAGFRQVNPGGVPQASAGMPPTVAAKAPAAPETSQRSANESALLQMLAKQQLRGLDPMNYHYGMLASLAGGEPGSGTGR